MKNNYSEFTTFEDIQPELNKVNSKKDIKGSGIPVYYDNDSIYVDEDNGHTLVIGSTGSGKTQAITMPKIWTSINAGENIIVDDQKGELYETFEKELKENGYKTIKLDFHDFNGNKWNPLKLAYEIYKEGNIDDAVMLFEKLAYYIFDETNNDTSDPFWANCCKQLFVGTIFYIIEKENRLPNIEEVANYASKITVEEFNQLSDNSPAKIFLRVILTAPNETRGSIYAVFNNAVMCYSYANKITELLSVSDFELRDILENKVAVFITDGHKKSYVTNLVSVFMEELYYVCDKENSKTRINIILDDFNDYPALENFSKLLNDTRRVYMEFTILVNSLHKLNETYGETNLEHIISHFIRIIYVFANDEFTLEYISNMCGNKKVDERLITTTELKLLKQFEVVILKNRQLPFKTKILPFYQYTIK